MVAGERANHITTAMQIEQPGIRSEIGRSIAPRRDRSDRLVDGRHSLGQRPIKLSAKRVVPLPLLANRRIDSVGRVKTVTNPEEFQDTGLCRHWTSNSVFSLRHSLPHAKSRHAPTISEPPKWEIKCATGAYE